MPANLAGNRDALVVLLDYSSGDGLSEYVWEHHKADLASGGLVYYSCPGQRFFRMAHAKNMAHRLAIGEGAQILANIDADNFVGDGFAGKVIERFARAAEDGEAIFLRTRQALGPCMDGGRVGWDCFGRIVASRNAFLAVGGYDERYACWSPDDKDFTRRLTQAGWVRHGLPRQSMRTIEHDDRLRFANYAPGQPRNTGESHARFDSFFTDERVAETVVNAGAIGCGVVYRNFDPTPIELNPLPTRIFGVGMHKTATKSLAAAARILGFDGVHWPSVAWVRQAYDQIKGNGASALIDGVYCAMDLPVTLFWRELDAAYPGSKFILTVRDEGGLAEERPRPLGTVLERVGHRRRLPLHAPRALRPPRVRRRGLPRPVPPAQRRGEDPLQGSAGRPAHHRHSRLGTAVRLPRSAGAGRAVPGGVRDTRRDERRSPAAAAWRKLYGLKAWRVLRAAQLAAHPFCERPIHGRRLVQATVANHRVPHRGDQDLFFDPAEPPITL